MGNSSLNMQESLKVVFDKQNMCSEVWKIYAKIAT